MASPQKPTQTFDFSDYQITHPAQPLPGDEIDQQFGEVMRAANETIDSLAKIQRSDGALKNQIVTKESLAPGLYQEIVADVTPNLTATVAHVEDEAAVAAAKALEAQNSAASAQGAASGVAANASSAQGAAQNAATSANTASNAALAAQNSATSAQNAANSADGDAAAASLHAQTARAWAEYDQGTIPPNILAAMGITGDHWSSWWWAKVSHDEADRAANAVVDFQKHYLGAFAAEPPSAGLAPGAMYFDTALTAMRVWNGARWVTTTIEYTEASKPIQTNIVIDTSGWVLNGVNTTFSLRDAGGLPVTPAYASGCLVSLNGVIVNPKDYDIVASSIVFKAPPAAGVSAWMTAGLTLNINPPGSGGGSGDMEKALYDPDGDGKVTRAVTADHATNATNATSVPWTGVSDKPSAYPPSLHAHDMSDINNLSAALAAKQPLDPDLTAIAALSTEGRLSRNAGGTWFMDTTLYAASAHVHTIANVTGLQTALDGKQPLDADLTDIAALTGDGYLVRIGGGWALSMESFAPLNHTHAIIHVTGLQTALDGKAAASHTHAVADVLGLQTSLDGKAPLASPVFTGAPTSPQAAAYANNQLIANTAQVYSTVTTVPESYQTASYTLALADAGKMVTFDSINAVTLTIPPFASVGLPMNVRIDLLQLGSGQVSVAPGAGVTLLSRDSKKKLSGVCAGATLWKVGPDTWVLIGDIAA